MKATDGRPQPASLLNDTYRLFTCAGSRYCRRLPGRDALTVRYLRANLRARVSAARLLDLSLCLGAEAWDQIGLLA